MIHEKKMELFVVFQEKLALKINDNGFRNNVLEPILYNGINSKALDMIIENIIQDPEIQDLLKNFEETSIKHDLKIFLKKLMERFEKYNIKPDDNYIG